MSQYIAKKATLDIKQECSNRSCGCYTNKGYYIKYANRNVDGVLFVCEECFWKKYRTQCVVQDFTMHNDSCRHSRRTEIDHPTLRCIIRVFNKTIRIVKCASICLLIIATILVGILSKDLHLRDVDLSVQTNSIHITETISERIDIITERLQSLKTEERSEQ